MSFRAASWNAAREATHQEARIRSHAGTSGPRLLSAARRNRREQDADAQCAQASHFESEAKLITWANERSSLEDQIEKASTGKPGDDTHSAGGKLSSLGCREREMLNRLGDRDLVAGDSADLILDICPVGLRLGWRENVHGHQGLLHSLTLPVGVSHRLVLLNSCAQAGLEFVIRKLRTLKGDDSFEHLHLGVTVGVAAELI